MARNMPRKAQKNRQKERKKQNINKAKLEEYVNSHMLEESRKGQENRTIETMLKKIRDIQGTLKGLHGRLVELSAKLASPVKESDVGQVAKNKKGNKVAKKKR